MKKIVKNIVQSIALVALMSILILLMVSQAKAQGPILNRAEVVADRVYDYGPVGVDGSVIIRGLELEQIGSSLLLAFNVEVNGRAMNNRQSWRIIPELTVPETGQFIEFPTVLITGRQKERHFKRKERFGNRWLGENYPDHKTSVPKGNDTVITYRVTVPYEVWMDNAQLNLHQYLASPKEKRHLFSSHGYAVVKPEPCEPLVVTPPPVVIPQPPVRKTLSVNGEAYIQFPVGDVVIHPTFMDNRRELAKIENELGIIMDEPSFTLLSIQLTGYASPEASLALNERLSEGRTKSLKQYLSQRYAIAPEIIRISNVAEDWRRFRELVERSDLANKDRVLSIIDSDGTEDEKERKLRALPEWKTLLNDYFPLLRRVDYQILYIQEVPN